MKKLILPLIFLAFLALGQGPALAVELPFEIPPVPWPPEILSVANTQAGVGCPAIITVTARGNTQLIWDDYTQQFVVAPLVDVGGYNPTLISKVTVYYTKDPLMEGFVNPVPLTCVAGCTDQEGSTWQGQIPESVHTAVDDTVYYIVTAVDTNGNVAFEDPDPTQGPVTHDFPSSGTWGADDPSLFQAPFIDNDLGPECSDGNSRYAVCAGRNDAHGFGGVNIPEVDVKGVNMGVDAASLYLNMDMNASSIPKPGGYIEAYSFAFFNPDALDPNPNDTQFYKCYAALYAPELTTLPELIESFWDCECLTSPVLPDEFSCRITTCGTGTDCVRETVGNKLYFSVKHSNGGNKLFGSSSDANSYSKIVAASAQVDLNSEDIFVLSDWTRGASYYKRRHSYYVCIDCGRPDPVILTSATSQNMGDYDQCSLTWLQAPEPDANGYFVYRALSKTASADQITKLTSSILQPVTTTTYTDPTHLLQDGKTYWYFVSDRNTSGQIITPSGPFESDCTGSSCPFSDRWNEVQNQSRSCTTHDLIPPVAPIITEVSTDQGAYCELTIHFTAGDPEDPTMDRCMVYRDGVPITTNPISWIGDQTYEVKDEDLVCGRQYCYTVICFDVAGNESFPSTPVCEVPRDYMPPEKPRSLAGSTQPNSDITQVKIKLTWQANTEEDFASYHVWECESTNQSTMAPCKSSGAPVPGNYTDIATINDINTINYERTGFTSEDDGKYRCYALTAHDTGGNPESPLLYFPVQPYSAYYPYGSPCVQIKPYCEIVSPGGTTATAVSNDAGTAIEVSWSLIRLFEGGTPFACSPDCNSAADWLGDELIGYVVTAVETGQSMPTPGLEALDPAYYPYICAIVPGPNVTQAECKTFLDSTTQNPHVVETGKTYTVCVWGRDASDNFSPYSETICDEVTVTRTIPPLPPVPDYEDAAAVKELGYIYFGFNKSPDETSGYKPTYEVYRCIDTQTNDCSNPETAVMEKIQYWVWPLLPPRPAAPQPGDEDYVNGFPTDYYVRDDLSSLPGYNTSVFYYYLRAVDPINPELKSDYSAAVVMDLGLAPPTNLSASTENNTDVILTWTMSDECESPTSCPSLMGYRIYRCGVANDCDNDSNYSFAAPITPATLEAWTLSSESAGDWYYKLTSLGADGTSESTLARSVKTSTPVTINPPLCQGLCVCGKVRSRLGGETFDIDIPGGLELKIYNEPGTTLLKTVYTESDGSYCVDLDFEYPYIRTGTRTAAAMTGDVIQIKLVPKAGIMNHGSEILLRTVTLEGQPVTEDLTAPIITEPATQCALVGDVNYNGENCCRVNGQDFMILKPHYNQDCADPQDCPTDFNRDGKTNGQDFMILKMNYNTSSCD